MHSECAGGSVLRSKAGRQPRTQTLKQCPASYDSAEHAMLVSCRWACTCAADVLGFGSAAQQLRNHTNHRVALTGRTRALVLPFSSQAVSLLVCFLQQSQVLLRFCMLCPASYLHVQFRREPNAVSLATELASEVLLCCFSEVLLCCLSAIPCLTTPTLQSRREPKAVSLATPIDSSAFIES
jgi:hypothetical protein